MFETVMVIFIFFILLVFGFVFYGKFFKSSSDQSVAEQSQVNAVQIAQRIAELPELLCTEEDVREFNCVDLFKLQVIRDHNLFNDELQYFDMLGFSRITFKQISPVPASDPELESTDGLVIYNKAPPNIQKESKIHIPTIIYDPTGSGHCDVGIGTCSFGLIEVTVYS